MLRLRSDIPEVKERGVVQIERGDKWHQPGQSLNGVLWSGTSNKLYILLLLQLSYFHPVFPHLTLIVKFLTPPRLLVPASVHRVS